MATTTTSATLATSATAASASATATHTVAESGVLAGVNPIIYNPSNPIQLFIVQAAIIIIFCRLLHYPLRYLGQPRVIAEVIGGILLGPSVMMRIPGFQSNIFPTDSMAVLNNVANLGLILFLFLTGLEVDLRLFRRNWTVALSVSIASIALPFGLGYAIAWGLYRQFNHELDTTQPIGFGVFGLFIGTALSITAFPVLCRILSELNLLSNIVGITVLAAGVGNDVVGWILLALCIALVNSSSGLTALWILFVAIGWVLILVFAVRPAFIWLLRRNGSLHNGPTESMVCVTLLLVLTSAWFTGIIGIHPIFGGFLVGIICPHEGGFAIKLTEKIEDFVSALFLPLYFALSGLSTNLGLLDNGITWAYVVGVIAVAFSGKLIGGTLAARLCKMYWRESVSIGILMSCKGLVELIVLNIGYQAKILSQRTFTIFVVMALVTTVSTTPLTKLAYPLWYQQKTEKYRRGEIDWDGNPTGVSSVSADRESFDKINRSQVQRLLVYLRLDSLPSLFTFISLLGGADGAAIDAPLVGTGGTATTEKTGPDAGQQQQPPPRKRRHLQVHGIRMLELTERTSSVMQVTEVDDLSRHDPVVNTFRTFSQLHDLAVSGQVAVVPTASYPEALVTEARETGSDFALIPWGDRGLMADDQSVLLPAVSGTGRFDDRAHMEFVRAALNRSVCDTGIFIDNGFGGIAPAPRSDRPPMSRTFSVLSTHSLREPAALPAANKGHRIFFPFFGGADDRVALRLVMQLAKNKHVIVTVARIVWPDSNDGDSMATFGKVAVLDDEPSAEDLGLLASLQSSLAAPLSERVSFVELAAPAGTASAVLDKVVVQAAAVVGQSKVRNAGDLVVVGRNHMRFGDENALASSAGTATGSGPAVAATAESSSSSSAAATGTSDLARTVGAVGARMTQASLRASVLVVQARQREVEA